MLYSILDFKEGLALLKVWTLDPVKVASGLMVMNRSVFQDLLTAWMKETSDLKIVQPLSDILMSWLCRYLGATNRASDRLVLLVLSLDIVIDTALAEGGVATYAI